MTKNTKAYTLHRSEDYRNWSEDENWIYEIHKPFSTVDELECLIRGVIAGRSTEFSDSDIPWSARFYLTESTEALNKPRPAKPLIEGDCITVIRKFTELLSKRKTK